MEFPDLQAKLQRESHFGVLVGPILPLMIGVQQWHQLGLGLGGPWKALTTAQNFTTTLSSILSLLCTRTCPTMVKIYAQRKDE